MTALDARHGGSLHGEALRGRLVNATRTSRSIPWKLVREGRGYLVPLYVALRSSELAREGMDYSGSYRFADHLYVRKPKGRWGVGRWLDWALLQFPSARSLRSRYVHARESVVRYVRGTSVDGPIRVASVPCGITRELADATDLLRRLDPERLPRVVWTGVDLDPTPLALSQSLMVERGTAQFRAVRRDVFAGLDLGTAQHVITSTGLGEFLSDDQLVDFYRDCRASLVPGGWLVTSATRRHALSDFLLRTFGELHTQYREREALVSALELAGFERVYARYDPIGLQTLAVAVR